MARSNGESRLLGADPLSFCSMKLKKLHPAWSIGLLTVFFLAIALLFAPQFEAMGDWILERFGLPGLFTFTVLGDFLPQPFPPDIPLYSFILSGSPFWITTIGVGLMSVLGGVLGYWSGHFLQEEGAMKFIGRKRYRKAHELFEEHGFLAVLIAALSPVPFNVVCWAAGVFGMSFRRFLLSALFTRVPRFVLVGLIAVWMG